MHCQKIIWPCIVGLQNSMCLAILAISNTEAIEHKQVIIIINSQVGILFTFIVHILWQYRAPDSRYQLLHHDY